MDQPDLDAPSSPAPTKDVLEYPTGTLAHVTRLRNQIEGELMKTDCSFSLVSELIDGFYRKKVNFIEVCKGRLRLSEVSENDKRDFVSWYTEKCKHMDQSEVRFRQWLQNNDPLPDLKIGASATGGKGSVRATSTRSSRSSILSGTSSARARLAEKKAKLLADYANQQKMDEVKSEMLLHKHKRQEEILRLQQQSDLVDYNLQKKFEDVQRKRETEEAALLEKELCAGDVTNQNSFLHNPEFNSLLAPQFQKVLSCVNDSVFKNTNIIQNSIKGGLNAVKVDTFSAHKKLHDPIESNDMVSDHGCKKLFGEPNLNILHRGDASNGEFKPLGQVNTFGGDQLAHFISEQNKISLALLQLQNSVFLPRHEPTVFSGSDVTKFKSFESSFVSLIMRRCVNDADKYYFLEKYTSEEAQKLVQSCNEGDPEVAFQPAWRLLHERYANEFIIAQTYVKKLENWPLIKAEDPRAMQDFSIFLTTCRNTLRNTKGVHQLESPTEIERIVMKLPFDMRKRYRGLFRKAMLSGNVSFQHLVEFVAEQAMELNMPILGNIKDPQFQGKDRSSANKRVFATKAEGDAPELACLSCGKTNHVLDRCFFFAEKSHDEKLQFLRDKKLCFACLRDKHFSSSCNDPLKCKYCDGRHPSCLHRDNEASNYKTYASSKKYGNKLSLAPPVEASAAIEMDSSEEQQNKSVFSTNSQTDRGLIRGVDEPRSLSPAVPVNVRLRGTKHFTKTYLGMDGYSSDSFMSYELMKKLGAKGTYTKFNLTTMNGIDVPTGCLSVTDIEVVSLDGCESRILSEVFVRKLWPFTVKDTPSQSDVAGKEFLKDLPIEFVNSEIGILVGRNTPELLRTLEIVCGEPNEVFASRHVLGWALNGPVNLQLGRDKSCYLTGSSSLAEIENNLERFYAQDFLEVDATALCPSVEDGKWLDSVESSIRRREDGYFEINLPFKNCDKNMPANDRQVLGRFLSMKKRFMRDESYFKSYKEFMEGLIEGKFMERVPANELEGKQGRRWFLTHFAVVHPQKKKLRVVFDCSLRNAGVSLNDRLLQGPDLINNLLGLLLRFRRDEIAFMADVEKMFLQVKVPKEHSDYMRIFWFPDGDLHQDPVQYRLTSHTFGAVSSPSIANYALKNAPKLNMHPCSERAKNALERNFYMDDWLQSVDSDRKAFELVKEVIVILDKSHFNLTSFVSNSRALLEQIPREKLSTNYKALNFERSDELLPQDRVLGVRWLVEEDSFAFQVKICCKEMSRRRILSVVSSIFDPLGIAGPVVVQGRAIFQETCRKKLDWDDPLPVDLGNRWLSWMQELPLLEDFRFPRYLGFAAGCDVQLHIFSDGSQVAYGAAAYVRITSMEGKCSTHLYAAKARLTPIGNTALKTIPRIELNGARLAVSLSQMIKRELKDPFTKEVFWTDSETVLKYITNETSRFQRFVANRVSFIRSITSAEQWRHIPGSKNISDLLSRGCTVTQFSLYKTPQRSFSFIDFCKRKFPSFPCIVYGPAFLWLHESEWPPLYEINNSMDDLEIIKEKLICTTGIEVVDPTTKLIRSSSSWYKVLYRVAAVLRMRNGLRGNNAWKRGKFSLAEINEAETSLWRFVQGKVYMEQLKKIRCSKPLNRGDPLEKLSPMIDHHGLLRVGGRLNKSGKHYEMKHPIILPQKDFNVHAVATQCHIDCAHMGRNYVLSVLRERYWIVGASGLLKRIVNGCVGCRKRNARPSSQLMAPLPIERVSSGNPAFWHSGVDFFGPWKVAAGKSTRGSGAQLKRYGVVFTCLSSRAVHLEVAATLETSSFIDALRRFLARRGSIHSLHSDNGTNLVGSFRELREALNGWNQNKMHHFCLQRDIVWKFSPPTASHFGGSWEREIRSVRKIIDALINEQHRKLSEESLRTLMCEAESVLNNRPLTPLSTDPNDCTPLTPGHILLLRAEPQLPPGDFDKNDMYIRQRWKRIQYLADIFWKRWRKEYLGLLQERQKWIRPQRSHQRGDLVLVVDYLLPRNQWCLGRIVDTKVDTEGRVRAATVRVSRCKEGRNLNISSIEIERPIAKLILLRAFENE